MESPIRKLAKSVQDTRRLMEIHADVGGEVKGRRYGLDVLNKSGIVFLASAWEAFVEDVATQAIDHIVAKAENPDSIPLPIRKSAAKGLEEDKNQLKVWDLAGEGWKTVVKNYRDKVIKDEISTFNTPKPHNVNALFKKLLGIEKVSMNWYWQGMSEQGAYDKLKAFIETRGAIAHRGKLTQNINKGYVEDHRKFINRISVRTSNLVRDEVINIIGSHPWQSARYGKFR
jgi:hypothetical protein